MADRLTTDTLYLFVTCCVERSRYDVLQQVIGSLKDEQEKKDFTIQDDMIIFDNGSTYDGTLESLTSNFDCPIYSSTTNRGYWSAIDWVLCNVEKVKDYKYIYIIESDHFHFALDKIKDCEEALNKYLHLGSVRTQEYSVKDKKLYDKDNQRSDSRRYAWVSHKNQVTGKEVSLKLLDESLNVYESNFLTCLHSVNRLPSLKIIFENLRKSSMFEERDFQRKYHDFYRTIGQLDGGVFHARLGFTIDNSSVLSGSWSVDLTQHGYLPTRQSSIQKYDVDEIKRIK